MTEYNITPVAKPRMTSSDKWNKRPATSKYWAFKQECRLKRVAVDNNDNITFVLPMPKSWSKKKRLEMDGQPHTSQIDLDNLLKGLWDACCDEDSHLHTVTVRKIWGYNGHIIIER